MHLKTLTLRGFKSFASATTLSFEPGITCVVGPNGSGKSNVVDAIAWVMGEQGAKSLRGGKMEDVVFAGTSNRAPLGRAEVALTIDNTDGALPIDYAEVTITRTMFRNGGSEYAINGDQCRLLDVQDLLSDSGIGREMHVIVGQGRLDAILRATPEERRGFIEEAAGVLKHRKRKEKALRKLDAMSGNLTRLSDLTSELRRQLKPLGRQAELARRAQVIQADLRDARLRLLADDVVTLSSQLAQEEADEAALRTARDEIRQAIETARAREAELDAELSRVAPRRSAGQELVVALTSRRERFAGMRSVATERLGRSEIDVPAEAGVDPAQLETQAQQLRREDAALAAHVTELQQALAVATAEREQAQRNLGSAEVRLHAARRAVADRREGLARLRGKVASAHTRHETRSAEIVRLTQARADAEARAAAAAQALAQHEGSVDAGDVDEGVQQAVDQTRSIAEQVAAEWAARRDAAEELARAEAAQAARVEALRMGLERKDAAATVLAARDQIAGVLGSVAALVTVRHGFETAVGAALGALADGVAVSDPLAAAAAMELLAGDEGRVQLLVAGEAEQEDGWPTLPPEATYAMDALDAQPSLRAALARVLRRVAVVDDLAAARRLVAELDVVAVTRAGEVLGRGWAAAGRVESLLEVQAAVDAAREELAAVRARREQADAEVAHAAAERDEASAAAEAAMARLREVESGRAAVAKELGALDAAARSAGHEVQRQAKALAAAEQALAQDEVTLAEAEARLAAAEAAAEEFSEQPGDEEVTARKHDLEARRSAETEARLAVRTAEERHVAVVRRAEELEAQAVAVRRARERLERQRQQARDVAAAASAVLAALDVVEPQIAEWLSAATAARDEAEATATAHADELRALRADLREWEAEAARLSDSVHRDEMAKAQQQLRIEAAQEKALADFGVDAETLAAEYGPDQLIAPSAIPVADADDAAADESDAEPIPYRREEQEVRAKRAERDLAALGRVNPLALEEFSAMQERQAFLTEQLEDLKRGREDLLGIVADVDDRVRQVFAEAYADVAVQFEAVFSRLFPGGEGRLLLTDPDDLLTTGVEVEARPPGKKIKRLSLLSGGERSLTAVAFLVALFKARPSPFYLLDEVEAALDDVNLGRLLDLLEELRATSQLLVITHQKRTMEIADALYGITMRDGVTSVISQRLRETV